MRIREKSIIETSLFFLLNFVGHNHLKVVALVSKGLFGLVLSLRKVSFLFLDFVKFKMFVREDMRPG